MPSIDYAEVKSRVTLDNVFRLLGWVLSQQSGYRGRCGCPACNVFDNRCVAFNRREGSWYCHKCKKGGSVLDFYAAARKLGLYEATVDLCNKLGMFLPEIAQPDLKRASSGERDVSPVDRED